LKVCRDLDFLICGRKALIKTLTSSCYCLYSLVVKTKSHINSQHKRG